MTVLAVSLLLIAASASATGVALLIAERARVCAGLLVAGGLTLAGGAVALDAAPEVAELLITAACALLLPTAMVTYPDVTWRHPIAYVALVVVIGGGALATLVNAAEWTSGMTLAIAIAACVLLWWRLETGDAATRRALAWAWGSLGATGFVGLLALFAADGTPLPLAALGLIALVGPAVYVGVLSPEVVDVRGLVSAVVVFLTAGMVVVAVFILAMALVMAAGIDDPSLGVTGLIAFASGLTLGPVRERLRLVVDQVLFGRRPDPLKAASTMAGQIGDDLHSSLRAVREGLVLPYVAHHDGAGGLTESGTPTPHLRRFPLGDEQGSLGDLVVGLRAGDLALGRDEQAVLALVASLLSQTLRARALSDELGRARGRTIAALEDERRRLRRDLHDGLGPRLSGVAFTADAARRLLRQDPEAADALVAQLRADTTTAIEEIRGLVYGMRPPALDDLGLIEALRQQAVGLRAESGSPVTIHIEAPDGFDGLPAAVEVAAYRIVVEALANVARHSGAERADVRLECRDGILEITVQDNGSASADWAAGVGLRSMRERAAELGGSVEAGPSSRGGCVVARLPLTS